MNDRRGLAKSSTTPTRADRSNPPLRGPAFLLFVDYPGDILPVGAPRAQLLSSPAEKPSGTPAPVAAHRIRVAASGSNLGGPSSPSALGSMEVPAPACWISWANRDMLRS